MPIQFKFLRIDVPQFAILVEDTVTGPFGISSSVNFSMGGQNIIKCSLKIVYLKDSSPVTQLVVETYFAIEQSSWKQMEKEDVIIVPAGFLQHLAALTLSTARGIQYAKTTEIGISDYIIPPTNLAEIIKEDMIIKKAEV